MSDWYVSSAAYAAIAAFVPSAVYSIGNIVKPTAPVAGRTYAYRCTTAGTASTEPTWVATAPADGNTVTTGGVTFTNVTGRSAQFWTAAAGDIGAIQGQVGNPRFVAGDRIFISSDHAETQSFNPFYGGSGNNATPSYTGGQVLCVNRAGSTPPVATDLTTGAVITCSSANLWIESAFPVYYYGLTYAFTGTSNGIRFNNTSFKSHFLDNCVIYLNNASATQVDAMLPAGIILNNTQIRFGATTQRIGNGDGYPIFVEWRNTSNPFPGSAPAILFAPASFVPITAIIRGVDLSTLTGTLLQNNSIGNSNCGCKILLDSCRIASGLTRYSTAQCNNTLDEVELVNCFDGTNFISERHVPAGDVTTEFTITLSGGATDNVGTFSHKMVSNTNIDAYVNTLNGFWMDANLATTGSSKTATVEIISSASLNNNDISLLLEYEGTASSSVASFVTSLPANMLTTATAVTTSTATWNSSPATPVRQHLQVTFTPRTAGRVRAQVRLGKTSTTVYVDPQVTIT